MKTNGTKTDIKNHHNKNLMSALSQAKKFAQDGPRVAAVIERMKPYFSYQAIPGFIDCDTEEMKQIVLVTPDGRLWLPQVYGESH